MKLEDQVCTQEQAKKIKELGVIQKSLFYHHPAFERPVFGEEWTTEAGKQYKKTLVCNDKRGSASAFTVAELGVLLPKGLGGNDGHNWSFYHRHCWKGESVGYSSYGINPIEQGWFITEAESRADMLIQLLEIGKATAEECNKRLNGK